MRLLKLSGPLLAIASFVGLMAPDAVSIEFCLTQIRNFPAVNAQDQMTMSCSTNGLGATTGTASASHAGGNRSLNANKAVGGAGLRVISQGIDNAGNVVCTAEDATTGGSGNNEPCGSNATRWRGLVEYVE